MKSVNWRREILSILHCLMMALKISKRSVHLQIKYRISVNVRTLTELLYGRMHYKENLDTSGIWAPYRQDPSPFSPLQG
jgi:hypothetical protein